MKRFMPFLLLSLIIIFTGCAVVNSNYTLGLKGETLKYPVSFTSFIHDEQGKEIKAGSQSLKRIKHFEIFLQEDTPPKDTKYIDVSDTLNKIVEKYQGVGIVNLNFSRVVPGGGSKSIFKYIFGQLGGSVLSSMGIYYAIDKKDYTKGSIYLLGGVGLWMASTHLIGDRVLMKIEGDVVKWRK